MDGLTTQAGGSQGSLGNGVAKEHEGKAEPSKETASEEKDKTEVAEGPVPRTLAQIKKHTPVRSSFENVAAIAIRHVSIMFKTLFV